MANPLEKAAKSEAKRTYSAQEAVDRGNARLEGREPYMKSDDPKKRHLDGGYHPRDDIRWRLVDGKPVLGFIR